MRFLCRAAIAMGAIMLVLPTAAAAHCDGLDGPVVKAARIALESGDPNLVLIWVQPRDEAELRRAFEETISVRKIGPQVREVVDRSFFETLVRLHRSGEGAPYTGLKPAGRDLGRAIPLADRAVSIGSARELTEFFEKTVDRGIHERIAELQRKRSYSSDDIAAGRAYIAAYVSFVHYVEVLHNAAMDGAEGHYPERKEAQAH